MLCTPANTLAYGRYTFRCRLKDKALLPPYKGSTFRGVFGHALKKVCCVLKYQHCDSCPLRQNCIYTKVFETQLAIDTPAGLRVTVPPHPFVIEPPATDRKEFAAGERFECRLLLFGEINRSLPYFIYAFDCIGEIGIGKKINGRRTRFMLEEVSANGEKVYDIQNGELRNADRTLPLAVRAAPPAADGAHEIELTLETPLRLKYRNRIGAQLPFHVLMRAVLRRISSVFSCYAGGEPDLDYRALLQRAEKVRILDSALRWHAWERYSNRQKQRMPLGGIVGSVTYGGRLAEFTPLIELAARLHIGKQTAFGLGRIGISRIEGRDQPGF